MSDQPMQVTQGARTEVQLLPRGTTLETIRQLLTPDLLMSRAKLTRLDPDEIREGPFPGQRRLFLSLEATDLPISPLGLRGWRGSADLTLEHYEEHDAPAVRIFVMGYSGLQDEEEASRAARVAWRLGSLLEEAFRRQSV